MRQNTSVEAVGKIIWLMGQSDAHRDHSVADLHRVILPPVALQQYRIWEHDGYPVGFMSCGLFDEETEAGYLNGTRLIQPDDWNKGEKLWLVDFIAPFGGVREILRDSRNHFIKMFGKGVVAGTRRSSRGKIWYAVA